MTQSQHITAGKKKNFKIKRFKKICQLIAMCASYMDPKSNKL